VVVIGFMVRQGQSVPRLSIFRLENFGSSASRDQNSIPVISIETLLA
jgi:hypothetical protein